MGQTSIEWTDRVWNPVTGCTKVSAGCAHCYAEGIAKRFWGERKFGDVRCHDDRLTDPLRWRKPARVFVNSMSDLFHEAVPFEFIAKVYAVGLLAQRHTLQILTKRPDNAIDFYEWLRVKSGGNPYDFLVYLSRSFIDRETILRECNRERVSATWPLPNVWLGTSIENQPTADERIPHLLRCPAAVRFLSCEPLLGAISLTRADSYGKSPTYPAGLQRVSDLRDIDWVIVGGESGHGARPCSVDWIRSIVGQCKEAAVPVFVKQLGAHVVDYESSVAYTVHEERCWPKAKEKDGRIILKHSKGGDMSEWPADLRVRQMPEARP